MTEQLRRALHPVWQGDTVYDESIMFTPDCVSDYIPPAPLLYNPEEVISVHSTHFQKEYIAGNDYIVEEGRLRRLQESLIHCFTKEDFFLKAPAEIPIRSVSCPGRYVRFEPGGVGFAKHQILVTYRHAGTWQGPVIQRQQKRLPRTFQNLETKRPMRILFFGDSVMEGCDSSGKSGFAPFLPPSDELLTLLLAEHFQHLKIQRINTAVGGKDSTWGRQNAMERAVQYKPDLAVIGFGMNDGSRKVPALEYRENISTIIRMTTSVTPEAEFLLLSPGLPNPDCEGWTGLQAEYASQLEIISHSFPGCVHVDITGIHKFLYTRKRYDDMSGNGINHPNDFLARINAQAMAACFIP